MYLMIAATIFSEYPKETRLDYVRRYYEAISKTQSQHPNTDHGRGQNTTCVNLHLVFSLMLMTPSIVSLAADMAIGKYVAQRAGIGINAGRIRGINAKIRGGEVQHTGVIPFLKKFEATVTMLHSERHQRWFCYSSLSYLAQRNRRHNCSQEQ